MLEHPLAFLPFEALMAALFFVCLRHAIGRGPQPVLQLLAGVGFGVLLEWATIEQLDAYSYGTQFLVMVGTVPIAIGVGWGVILYSAMLFTDCTDLKPPYRPIADALLALNIDLAMDAVAIRVGMWDWGKGLAHDYYGVPFENFWAWFWVIFCFSGSYRLFDRYAGKIRVVAAPLGAVVLGVGGVLATNRLIVSHVPESIEIPVIAGVLCSALSIISSQKPRLIAPVIHPLVAWVPLSFHLAFLLLGALTGVIFEHAVLVLVSLAMALVALYIHRPVLFEE